MTFASGQVRRIGENVKHRTGFRCDSASGKPVFFFFFSRGHSRRLIHYTIKCRKVGFGCTIFVLVPLFLRRDFCQIDFHLGSITDYECKFHVSHSSFWNFLKFRFRTTINVQNLSNAQSLLEAPQQKPYAKVGKVSLDSLACATYISLVKQEFRYHRNWS